LVPQLKPSPSTQAKTQPKSPTTEIQLKKHSLSMIPPYKVEDTFLSKNINFSRSLLGYLLDENAGERLTIVLGIGRFVLPRFVAGYAFKPVLVLLPCHIS